MLRATLDTNVVVSGLLWDGPPRRILDAARAGRISLFTSARLADELRDVIGRAKLASRLIALDKTPGEFSEEYADMTTVVSPGEIERASADPDDDHVLACALPAKADVIVSGDRDLLELKTYHGIEIVAPAELAARLEDEQAADN